MLMFCKDDRCGLMFGLCPRLKFGGYKMLDVISSNLNIGFVGIR